MVSMRTLQNLVDSVAAAGVPRSTFLSAARIEPACLEAADARLSRHKLFELMELALDVSGDPAFGLHSIERLTDDALNPLAALVTHAATLGDALTAIEKFRCLLGDEPSFRCYQQGAEVIVRCAELRTESLRVLRFNAEIVLAGLFRLIQRFRGEARVTCVAFAYSAPEWQREYARVFGGRERFNQPFTELRFDRELLAAAAPYADPELHETLRAFVERRVTRLTDGQSYADRIRELLLWQAPPRDVTMASMARKLGVSVRSLRRYLAAEGRPYPQLVNEALATLAKNHLRDEHS
jgi:hypothetical protein